MVPLLIAPRGGVVGDMPVQRTLATVRSVELDALLLAGSPPPAPDALVARDEKADTSGSAAVDPRVLLLVEECRRHYKAIGAWAEGVAAVGQAGATGMAGVVTSDDRSIVFSDVQDLMGTHRVWERFPASVG